MTRPNRAVTVCSYLKQLRTSSGKTQKEVARFLGHSTPQYVSNLEREKCEPSIEMALQLSDFYGGKRSELANVFLDVHRKSLDQTFFGKSAVGLKPAAKSRRGRPRKA